MTLLLDHIFVCTEPGGPEAEDLLRAGLVEGSRNVHPGQGTANRRFFFEHGFIELLWVHSEEEARSASTSGTRLWERWTKRGLAANSFGICFASQSTNGVDLPFASWSYVPGYLPPGKTIRFAEGGRLTEPELFALGWVQTQPYSASQPTNHRIGLRQMQTVSVGLVETRNLSTPLQAAKAAGLLEVHRSAVPELVIRFVADKPIQLSLPRVGLKLVGQPRSAA